MFKEGSEGQNLLAQGLNDALLHVRMKYISHT